MAVPTQSPKGYFVYFDYCVVLIAIVCNIIVLSAVIRGRFHLSGYRRFLISLATADLYVCTVNVLTMIYQIYTSYASPDRASSTTTLCVAKVLRTLQLAGFFASLLNIVGMSIDHFFGIVYPMNYRSLMNKHAARFAVAAVWVVSFTLDIPITIALYREIASSQSSPSQSYDAASSSSSSSFNFTGSGLAKGTNTSFLLAGRQRRSASSPSGFTTTSGLGGLYEEEEYDPASLFILEALFNNLKNIDENRNRSAEGSAANKSAFTIDQILLDLKDDEKQLVDQGDICTFFSISKMWFEMCVIALALLCFAFLTVCYGIILKKVSARMDSGKQTTRKLIFTTVLLLGAFMICWLPFMLFEFSMLLVFQSRGGDASESVETETLLSNSFFLHNVFNSVLMCYPLVDPIIYAARIPAVQQSILVYFANYFPCCSEFIFRYLNNSNQRTLSSKMPRLAKLMNSQTVFSAAGEVTSVLAHHCQGQQLASSCREYGPMLQNGTRKYRNQNNENNNCEPKVNQDTHYYRNRHYVSSFQKSALNQVDREITPPLLDGTKEPLPVITSTTANHLEKQSPDENSDSGAGLNKTMETLDDYAAEAYGEMKDDDQEQTVKRTASSHVLSELMMTTHLLTKHIHSSFSAADLKSNANAVAILINSNDNDTADEANNVDDAGRNVGDTENKDREISPHESNTGDESKLYYTTMTKL